MPLVSVDVAVVNYSVNDVERRKIYYYLEKMAVPTDIGWVVLNNSLLDILEKFNRELGKNAVKVYRVYMEPGTLLDLVKNSRKALSKAPRRTHIVNALIRLEEELKKKPQPAIETEPLTVPPPPPPERRTGEVAQPA